MISNIVVGLDVGTTKVCALVAESDRRGVNVLGMGVSPSAGIRKGIVVNIDATVDSVRKAVKEAEASSGIRIKSVSVGISGGHIKGLDSSGAVGIRAKEVTCADIQRAIDSAKAVYIPLDREVLHVIPTEFVLDGQDGITDPAGMSGVRLEARVHIITGAVSSIQNLLKCCEKAGLDVSDVVFEPLASAHCVLTGDEKQCGVVLLDIGGGTTDIALFREGSLRNACVLGVGGNHFTNDIAVGLRVNVSEAERLKRASGAAFAGVINASEEILINQAGGQTRSLPRKYIVEILQPRGEEMFELIKDELKKISAYETAVCGVVLTGGASLLTGLDKMAETVLALPVRAGSPENSNGLKAVAGGPEYSTVAGLVGYNSELETHRVLSPEALSDLFGVFGRRVKDVVIKYADYLNLNNRKEGGTLCLKSKK